MSVTVEFSVPSDAFLLGQVLAVDQRIRIRLECIVPTSGELVPFVWVQTEAGAFESFETAVRDHPLVADVRVLDRLDDEALFHIVWKTDPESLMEAISKAAGTVLDGHSVDGRWEFTVRFLDHDNLTRFHNAMTERGIRLHIDRIHTESATRRSRSDFRLTDEQRAALVAAVEGGYFEVPRGIKLDEIAEGLGISRQAASERVRRGTDIILKRTLFGERSAHD